MWWAGHGEIEGGVMEKVRIQSWGGREGADQRLWVVDEDKCSKSEDESVGEEGEDGEKSEEGR